MKNPMTFDKVYYRFRRAIRQEDTTRVQAFLMHIGRSNQKKFTSRLYPFDFINCNAGIRLMLINATSDGYRQTVMNYSNFSLFQCAVHQGERALVEVLLQAVNPVQKQAMLKSVKDALWRQRGTTFYPDPMLNSVVMMEILLGNMDSSTKKDLPPLICWEQLIPV